MTMAFAIVSLSAVNVGLVMRRERGPVRAAARSGHPDTLATRHNIAREMAERGDHAGADDEYRDVLVAKLRVLGKDHPSTLATRHQIAVEIAERGDHAGAEAEFRDGLAARQRVLGPDHPSTLLTSDCVDALERHRRA